MWGLHLKQKGHWWHYYRSVPKTYHDIDARRLISFSLKTNNFAKASFTPVAISTGESLLEWLRPTGLGFSHLNVILAKRRKQRRHNLHASTLWSCPANVPVSELIYAAFRSNAKGLLPPRDDVRFNANIARKRTELIRDKSTMSLRHFRSPFR